MSEKIIRMTTKDGKVTIKTIGFHGAECQRTSDFLVKALGEMTAETLTPEYYEEEGLVCTEMKNFCG